MPKKIAGENADDLWADRIDKLRKEYNWDLRKAPRAEFIEALGEGESDRAKLYLSWIHGKLGMYNAPGKSFMVQEFMHYMSAKPKHESHHEA